MVISRAGCTHVVMEVSSHALMLDRVYGIPFAVGIYTNLSRDHLDFHKTMEAYCDAKALLMRQCDVGIYNADDPWAERLMADATCPRRFSYSVNGQADLMAKNVALEPGSVDFDAEADTEWCHVHVGIPALFTVYNTLDAMACCWNLGVPLAECADALAKNHGVKGRMEIIPTPGTGYTVLNDYAHKPDALEKVLQSAKSFAKGRVVALFGCGDSASYPDSFCDALAEIRDGLEATGCTFVGALDAAEYDGCTSRICRDGKVIGLAVDDGASEAVSDARMEKWIAAVGF